MRIKVIVLGILLGAGANALAQDFKASELRVIGEGRAVYLAQCTGCHGWEGRGSSADPGLVGPNLRQIAQRDGAFSRLDVRAHLAFGVSHSPTAMPAFDIDRSVGTRLGTLKVIRYVEFLQEPPVTH